MEKELPILSIVSTTWEAVIMYFVPTRKHVAYKLLPTDIRPTDSAAAVMIFKSRMESTALKGPTIFIKRPVTFAGCDVEIALSHGIQFLRVPLKLC